MKAKTLLLTENYIKQWCKSSSIYQRGSTYFEQGRVVQLDHDPVDLTWNAVVDGSDEYEVTVSFFNDKIDASCDCPAFYDNVLSCKHIVAVLLEIAEEQQHASKPWVNYNDDERKYENARQIIESFESRSYSAKEADDSYNKEPLIVEYICKFDSSRHLLRLELKIGIKRPYIVKDIRKFLQCLEVQSNYLFTNHFSYSPSEHYFLYEDQEIFEILQEIRKQEAFYRKQQNYFYSNANDRTLVIPPIIADSLFSKLHFRNTSFEDTTHVSFLPYTSDHKLPLSFWLEKGPAGDFQLDLTSLENVSFYHSYGWLVEGGTIYQLSPAQKELCNNLYRFRSQLDQGTLLIADNQLGRVISTVLPELKQIGRMEISEEVSDQIISPKLEIKMYVNRNEEGILVNLQFHYGKMVMHPLISESTDEVNNDVILVRETEKEQGILKIIGRTPFQYKGKECVLTEEEAIYEFLYTTVSELNHHAEIYMTSAVKSLILPKQHAPMTKIDMETGGNLLSVSFEIDGIDHKEVKQIIQSVIEKKKFHRLPSGTFVSLENESFQSINHLISELGITKAQMNKDNVTLPIYRGLQIESFMKGENPPSVQLSKKFRRLIQDLKNPDTIDYMVPTSLRATLRDYQQFGFGWLKTLAYYGFGGILADDMGLGKTLQAITYLLSEKNENKHVGKTSLIVCPASLVYNWKSEFEKFSPDLDVVVAYGTPEERLSLLHERKPDVFITSYPLLRQDAAFYEQAAFDSLILDEAQAIKNHLTKTAKAVKQINASKRFALSGTPIENSLYELWSIFDAVLPGFFPNHSAFRNMAPDRIAEMVRPFILRRVKQDVLKELPEKIETIHQSELTLSQKELYLGYLDKIQQETKESLQNEGFERSRIKILAGLTRLRQLCCHPSLFVENYHGHSGKLEQLQDIIENALENKRRLLIFSQFTSMLQMIREKLEPLEIGYFYLDGQTPSKERVEMAERFNQGENDIFLISLKAGGTGLNLTGADTVILYDLWWNPAIEEQAAGRAHRMGQKNSVHVMKLIARGTIEEKIYEMQQRKKELIQQVIQPGETTLSSLSEKEICEILGI
jgi:superfamily II DNA or RNA helicase